MIDLALTAKEAKEEKVEMTASPKAGDYPYGLTLNIESEVLDKLGLKSLPNVGDEVYFTAMAKVTRVSSNATDDGEDNCVCLQICEMQVDSIEPAAEEKTETPAQERREPMTIMQRY